MTDNLTDEQRCAFQLYLGGRSLCITGPAGCGKSYLIKYIVHQAQSRKRQIAAVALTGAAASLIKGQTLHRWAGIGLARDDSTKLASNIVRYKPNVRKRWQSIETLIIDEVSMMSAELFNKINHVAQQIRRNNSFFGGIQVIFCGDFAQLEPIKADRLCFETKEWQQYVGPNTIYLKQVLRQQDPDFLKLLSEVRLGKVTKETVNRLNQCLISSDQMASAEIEIEGLNQRIRPTILFPHKKEVERINLQELEALKQTGAETMVYKTSDTIINRKSDLIRTLNKQESENINKLCNAPAELELAVGAQVMLITNQDFERQLVNGSRGVVTGFKDGLPVVVFDSGEQVKIERKSFEINWSSDERMSRLQVPLILAWAMTIHKCQGATLTSVITDLSKVFCNAQTYVTLSRIRSLDGLFLTGINYRGIKCNPKVKAYYQALEGVARPLQ